MVLTIILSIVLLNILYVLLLMRNYNYMQNKRKSKLIVIDGTDGSGKQTQTELLVKRIRKFNNEYDKNFNIIHLSFPNYNNTSSTLVKEYLNGEYNITNPFQASLLYTVDRISTFIKKDIDGKSILDKYNNGKTIIICDRYTTSNILHQSNSKDIKLKFFIKMIELIEYKLCRLPTPDLVMYLDVSPKVCMDNIIGRYKGDNEKCDIHENIEHIQQAYEKRNIIIDKLKWKKVLCTDTRGMRSIKSISYEIFNIFQNNILM